jgi:hypothetical protein
VPAGELPSGRYGSPGWLTKRGKAMAKGTDTVTDVPGVIGFNEADYVWENVHEEAPDRLSFDTVGDKLIAEYLGHELVYPEETEPTKWFVVLKWRDNDSTKVVNAGYELRTAYVDVTVNDDGIVTETKDKIPPGTVTRNELVKLVDVDQASPMKSYRIDVARR